MISNITIDRSWESKKLETKSQKSITGCHGVSRAGHGFGTLSVISRVDHGSITGGLRTSENNRIIMEMHAKTFENQQRRSRIWGNMEIPAVKTKSCGDVRTRTV